MAKSIKEIFDLYNVILGSSSSSRKKILSSALGNTAFKCYSPSINESQYQTNDPETSAFSIANAKADHCVNELLNNKKAYNNLGSNDLDSLEAFSKNFNSDTEKPDLSPNNSKSAFILICSDQIAYFDSQIRQKPKSTEEAEKFILDYSTSGLPVEVFSALVIVNSINGKRFQKLERAKVWFKNIPMQHIKKIVNDGKVFSSAGGFLIDDQLMGPNVKKLEGNFDCVLGLPIDLLTQTLNELASEDGGWDSETLKNFRKNKPQLN